jgi:nucleotide-binding universal stress UspA family protein
MKIQHALVPLDHSELAEVALEYAVSLVAPGGRITLMTVVDTYRFVGMDMATGMSGGSPAAVVFDSKLATPPTQDQSAWEMTRQYLETIAERLAARDYVVETRLEEGAPAEKILDVAGELTVDAIVMSTHGRSGLSRWVMGSVAQKVLCAATCPVFLVPQRAVEHVERE